MTYNADSCFSILILKSKNLRREMGNSKFKAGQVHYEFSRVRVYNYAVLFQCQIAV
jgi:hypothetical protein